MADRSHEQGERSAHPVRRRDYTLSERTLFRIVGTFREPAFLVTTQGNIVFANDAAKERSSAPPLWLQSVIRLPKSKVFERFCEVCPLGLEDVELFLILPTVKLDAHGDKDGEEAAQITGGLPPSLARVADLLMLGLSDKEIAECTDLSLSSVRTYTSRIYRRLNVNGRQELLALALAGTSKT